MNSPSIVRVDHFGASGQYPEHTLLAFHRAIEQGVDALEIDIHRAAEDELVVIHDTTLERTTSSQTPLRANARQPEVFAMLDPSPQDGSLTPRQICARVLQAGANCLSCDFHFDTEVIDRFKAQTSAIPGYPDVLVYDLERLRDAPLTHRLTLGDLFLFLNWDQETLWEHVNKNLE